MSNLDNSQKLTYFSCICKIYHIITLKRSIFKPETLSNLESVKRKLNIIGQVHEYDLLLSKTCPIFLIFENYINNDNVKFLLDFDYKSLIQDDAYDENKKLITDLIDAVKEAWVKLSEKNQNLIKQNIKICLTMSKIYSL